MADRSFSGVLSTIGGRVRVVTCLVLVQDTAITLVNTQGVPAPNPLIDSVSRFSAGKYVIVMKDAYKGLRALAAMYAPTEENVDLIAQVQTVQNLGTATPAVAVVRLKTGTVNTDPSATGGIISMFFIFEDSGAY